MINIAVIGSTGSIGVQTLAIAERRPDLIKVVSLAAGTNIRAFCNQVDKFKPKVAALKSGVTEDFKAAHGETVFFAGDEAYLDAITEEADVVVVALVGFIGVKAVMKAIELGKNVALANKESLVVGGELVTAAARTKNVKLLPVDSEHSAIWQALGMDTGAKFEKLIITASGGAFRDVPVEKLKTVSAADALRHPNWQMGKRITVDCATMINKGFEVIEAKWLFGASLDDIEVVLHRESVIHSMVRFADGAVIAQLGSPTMEIPIQLAVTGERLATTAKPLDFAAIGALTFAKIDENRYPCFFLALECAKKGDNYPCALNAADEEAVGAFLKGEIAYTDIYAVLERTVRETARAKITSIDVLEAEDAAARRVALKAIGELNGKLIT